MCHEQALRLVDSLLLPSLCRTSLQSVLIGQRLLTSKDLGYLGVHSIAPVAPANVDTTPPQYGCR
jgi:hypothetical protein